MDQNENIPVQPQQEPPVWTEAPRDAIPSEPELSNPIQEQPAPQEPYYGPTRNEPPVTPVTPFNAHRQESPYANSPYVMQHPQPTYTYAPQYQSAPQTAPQPRKSGGFWKGFLKGLLSVILTLALVAGGCFVTARQINLYWSERMYQERQALEQQFQSEIDHLQEQVDTLPEALIPNPVGPSDTPASELLTPSQVYARNVGSVVAISNQSTTNYFGQISETASSGSGFIISEDGYVVTNYHVVSGATKLTVILNDGTEYEAQLIGGDENNDIALLKVEATGLTPVILGSSDALVVGDQVVAIGNPLGELTSTQTVGYISAKDRDITAEGITINMLQTDAAINSGNSGGPLFNMKGEVIGITSAKYSGTTGSGASIEGIGFAIPIDDVKGILSDLKEHGYVTGAYLGVSVRSMDPDVAKAYGLPTGAQVVSVEDGSCAKEAGVQEMDIIVKLGEFEISDINDLLRALRKYEPGETVTAIIWRAGAEVELSITLDEKPAPTE